MTKHSNNIFLSDGKLLTQEAKLNVLSCFDGMSCLRIALEELGIPINKYFASEIDKYAMTVANALFEDTIQVGSVEFVTKEMINHRIDLLAGGSPCQGFSFAGTQPKDEGIVIKDITVDGSDKIGAMRGRYIVDGKRQDYKMKTAGMTTQRIELRKDEKSNCITTVAKDNYLVKLFNTNPSGKGMNGWVYHTDYKSPTVTTNKGEGNKISHDGIWYRKLLPIECGRLQTIPEHILEKMLNCGVSNSQLYKMFGNGWTIKVVTHFLKGMSEKKEGKKKILLRADTHEPLIETGT